MISNEKTFLAAHRAGTTRQTLSSRMLRVGDENVSMGALQLPLGGKHGFKGVRGGQGRKKDKFQGTTPKKRHRTGHFDTPHEAAAALAELRKKLAAGDGDCTQAGERRWKQQSKLTCFRKLCVSNPRRMLLDSSF